MKIEIRPATINDVPAILEIFNYALIHTTAIYSYEPYTLSMMEKWFKEKEANNWPLFVAEKEQTVTGYVTYGSFRLRPAYQYTAEHSIYVDKAFRNQGIAGALMEKIIDVARENGIHSLIGGIDAENEISLRFHEKYGFEEVAYIKEVGYKFDRWLDLKFMQLILEK